MQSNWLYILLRFTEIELYPELQTIRAPFFLPNVRNIMQDLRFYENDDDFGDNYNVDELRLSCTSSTIIAKR